MFWLFVTTEIFQSNVIIGVTVSDTWVGRSKLSLLRFVYVFYVIELKVEMIDRAFCDVSSSWKFLIIFLFLYFTKIVHLQNDSW